MEKIFNSEIFLWVKENFLRLSTKSPKFFRKWQFIATILLGTARLPDLINSLVSLGIHVPDMYNDKVKLIVTCCSITGIFMGRLANQSTPSLDENGNIVKITDPKTLPFTAKKDTEHLLKEVK